MRVLVAVIIAGVIAAASYSTGRLDGFKAGYIFGHGEGVEAERVNK
jgi:hypothetical protein